MRLHVYTLMLAMLISGCAGVPEQTFNPDVATLDSIAVAVPSYQEELLLRYRNDQVESIGLFSPIPIGRLITYVAKENREAQFTESVETATSIFAENLQQQLEQQLTQNNVTVVAATLPDANAERDRNNLLKTIPQQAFNGASALLETAGQIGFTAAGRGKTYQATLWITVRLTAIDGRVLLQDQVLYNPPKTNARGVLLYPTNEYSFANQDELMDGERTTSALALATAQVSEELAFLLKGQTHEVQ
ncbi:MAG: hypothetical protein AB8G18_11750 [Gammaproteobacteria bacterium]